MASPDDKFMLDELQKAVTELKSTTKINEKKEILKKYPELKGILHYVYNPMFMYNVTSKNIKKFKKEKEDSDQCDFVMKRLLDNLRTRKWSGHEAIRKIIGYIGKYGHPDLVYGIIDKDLKIRMGAKQINDVFPKLIPTFEVALADTIEKQLKYFKKGGEWYISRKLDGVRCLCFIERNSKNPVSFYSREGREFTTLGNIADEIKQKVIPHLKTDIVIDGEVCLLENGVESFSGIMKLIKKSDFTIPNPEFIIFDLLTMTEFQNEKSDRILSERFRVCGRIMKKAGKMKTVKLLNQYLHTPEKFDEMGQYVEDEGWEGLMLRKDVEYEGKRTKNLLKVKKFHREEYKVIKVVGGKVSNNGGKHSNQDGVKSVQILHKGCIVDVGSGFSDNERIFYYNNQQEILGKIISVQFFEETVTEKKGEKLYSLRFPTFKGVYGVKRDY